MFPEHEAIIAGLYLMPKLAVNPTLCSCKHMQTTTYEVVQGSYVPTSDAKQQNSIKVVPLQEIFLYTKMNFHLFS